MPQPPVIGLTATVARDGDAKPVRVRVNAAYVHAIEQAGALPVVLPPLADAAAASALLRGLDALVLTGGEDVDPAHYGADAHPQLGPVNAARDATELALARAARDRRLPTLAICRGIQLLNVALGGTLVQDIASECPRALDHERATARDSRVHDVAVEPDSALAAALGAARLAVNSFHHQSIARVADPLRVTATAPDGIVEGVEGRDPSWWLLGVQWHPEELVDTSEPWDRALFAALVRAATRGDQGIRGPGSGSRDEPAVR